jgi:HK97 family phage portal protein
VYDVTDFTSVGGTGRMRRLLQDQVFHLRDRSDDGLIGRSRLQRAAAVIQAGISVQSYATGVYSNGVLPSGVAEADAKLDPGQRSALAARIRHLFAASANAGKVLILDQGVKWKSISMSPENAEFLASRRFTVEELARLFGCSLR